MKYDFTTFLKRAGHDALAYDGLGLDGFPKKGKAEYSPISMWVADMNFVAFPDIHERPGVDHRQCYKRGRPQNIQSCQHMS